MSAKLFSTCNYRIIVADGSNPPFPIGIATTGKPYEAVRLKEPIQIWRVEVLDNTDFRIDFVLGSGDYYATRVFIDEQIGEKVVASKNPEDNVEWRATYRHGRQAWTVERSDQPGRGWQALVEENSPNPHIAIRDIEEPFYAQLFQFEKVEN